MSLAYQFVTPLTSMTIRGMTDEDGLMPTLDKPPESMNGTAHSGQPGDLGDPNSPEI